MFCLINILMTDGCKSLLHIVIEHVLHYKRTTTYNGQQSSMILIPYMENRKTIYLCSKRKTGLETNVKCKTNSICYKAVLIHLRSLP